MDWKKFFSVFDFALQNQVNIFGSSNNGFWTGTYEQ